MKAPLPSASSRKSRGTLLPGGRLALLQGVLGVVVFALAQVIAAVAASPLVFFSTGDVSEIGALLSDPLTSTCFFLIYAALSILGYFWLTRRFAPRDNAFTFARKGIASELAAGAVLGGGLVTCCVVVLAALGVYRGHDFGLNPGLVAGIAMGIGAACGEEVLFRGFLFRLVSARFGSTCAIALVSLIFGLVHVGNPGAGLSGGFAIVLCAGLLLNAAYLLTDRIWLPIGIHFAWNAAQSGVFGITVSGTETGRGLWRGELVGPHWLSGGEMGIEGSIALIALGVLAGIVTVILCVRNGRWRSLAMARRKVAGEAMSG